MALSRFESTIYGDSLRTREVTPNVTCDLKDVLRQKPTPIADSFRTLGTSRIGTENTEKKASHFCVLCVLCGYSPRLLIPTG
jgi:hypothetical protein